jgi:hypothetical protein
MTCDETQGSGKGVATGWIGCKVLAHLGYQAATITPAALSQCLLKRSDTGGLVKFVLFFRRPFAGVRTF